MYPCRVWCDHLEAKTAQILARFAEGSPAAACPAVTVNTFGNGKSYAVAGLLDQRFCDELMRELRPINTEVRAQSETVTLEGSFVGQLGRGEISGPLQLGSYEIAVLTRENLTGRI